MKTLIVVSGGDAPGISAAIAHFCEEAERHGDTVLGALGGFRAVLGDDLRPLRAADVLPFAGLGGSYLPSSRDPVLNEPAGREMLRAVIRRHGVDNLLLFGGDGSLRYLPPVLADLGIATVGIPATVDNDVAGTERTLGFDSACQYACHSIDGIRATGHALSGRLFSVETLGGHTGMLALAIAAGVGADAVLVPEYDEPDLALLADRLREAIVRKGHALLVYTEFIPERDARLALLSTRADARLRDTRLGHAQRGGAASHSDRLLARGWATLAHRALHEGAQSAVTVWRSGGPALHEGALTGEKPLPDRALYAVINGHAR